MAVIAEVAGLADGAGWPEVYVQDGQLVGPSVEERAPDGFVAAQLARLHSPRSVSLGGLELERAGYWNPAH